MSANCPLIVDDMQDAGRLIGRGDVEGVLEVALGGRAVADPHTDRISLASVGEGHRCADGLRELRADGAGNRDDVAGGVPR